MDLDEQGNPTAYYVYGMGLISKEEVSSNETYYYHFDRPGSTIALTNSTGVITDTYEYDNYGELLNHTGTTQNRFLYNGRDGVQTDSNGLYYMRNRYYSPEIKRFVNRDVVQGNITDAQTFNRYSYVNGNPISYIDPFGLSKESDSGGFGQAEKSAFVGSFLSSGKGLSKSIWEYGVPPVVVYRAVTDFEGYKSDLNNRVNTIINYGDTYTAIENSIKSQYNKCVNGNSIDKAECAGGGTLDLAVNFTPIGAAKNAKYLDNLSSGYKKIKNKKKPYSNSKIRPRYANGQVEKVWETAIQPDGNVYDPFTGELITWDKTKSRAGQWDMGHKPGKEYNKLWKRYMDGEIDLKTFKTEYRNHDNYVPQSIYSNRSHKFEQK